MGYDSLVIAAHPDDAEIQMGGTIAKLVDGGQRVLLVDLTDGEPTEFAEPGHRAHEAAEAARILEVDRVTLRLQDRLLADDVPTRIEVARLIRLHQPRWVYSTGEACVHPDHAAVVPITRAAVFLARLGQWERVPGGERLAEQPPWTVDRFFFPHCRMEPPWADFAFAVDVSAVYDRKRRAVSAYRSVLGQREDRLIELYEAEDQYYGRRLGVAYAEIFRAAGPLLVEDPTVFRPVLHG